MEKKTKIIHVAVEPDLRTKIYRRAKAENLTPSAIIRIALHRFLEAQSTEKAA